MNKVGHFTHEIMTVLVSQTGLFKFVTVRPSNLECIMFCRVVSNYNAPTFYINKIAEELWLVWLPNGGVHRSRVARKNLITKEWKIGNEESVHKYSDNYKAK